MYITNKQTKKISQYFKCTSLDCSRVSRYFFLLLYVTFVFFFALANTYSHKLCTQMPEGIIVFFLFCSRKNSLSTCTTSQVFIEFKIRTFILLYFYFVCLFVYLLLCHDFFFAVITIARFSLNFLLSNDLILIALNSSPNGKIMIK